VRAAGVGIHPEGPDQIAVRGDVFQPVEARPSAFQATAADEMGAARVLVGAECSDQVAVGGDVLQPVEGDLPPFVPA
jgi:hypothetical protein